jgi:excisionase family DNA binding protein
MPVPEPDDTAPEPRLVSVETFARTIGVSRSTGYNLLDAGEVRSVRFNNRRLIPAEEVTRFADELLAQAR